MSASKREHLLPINMCVADEQWRLYMHRSQDKRFEVFRHKVLDRDRYACRYCGYISHTGLHIINRDRNYRNNKLTNMVSACGFCAQCFFLDAIGQADFGGGVLIHLPTISQNDLNTSIHVLFSTMVAGLPGSTTAKSYYRSLRLLSQSIENQFGSGMSDPAFYGRMLIDMGADKTAVFHESFLQEVRLLPDIGSFHVSIQDDMLADLRMM